MDFFGPNFQATLCASKELIISFNFCLAMISLRCSLKKLGAKEKFFVELPTLITLCVYARQSWKSELKGFLTCWIRFWPLIFNNSTIKRTSHSKSCEKSTFLQKRYVKMAPPIRNYFSQKVQSLPFLKVPVSTKSDKRLARGDFSKKLLSIRKNCRERWPIM